MAKRKPNKHDTDNPPLKLQKPKGLIAEDGAYDLSIDDYHGQPCVGPSTSASGLKQVLDCPAKYWAFSQLNPSRFPPPEKSTFNIGRAAHALALGEPEFYKSFVISPYDEFRTKESKAWRDAQKTTVLKEADFEVVKIMAAGIKRSRQVSQAFTNGMPEVSLIYKDRETGIYLKSRPDWMPNDPQSSFLVEYKTAATLNPRMLSNAVFDYGYHIQAALQIDAVIAVCGVEPLGIAHVVQEKDPPYLAELRMFTPDQIDIGRQMYRRALRKFARFLKSGDWPGYTTGPTYFTTPYHVAARAEEIDPDDQPADSTSKSPSHEPTEYLAAL